MLSNTCYMFSIASTVIVWAFNIKTSWTIKNIGTFSQEKSDYSDWLEMNLERRIQTSLNIHTHMLTFNFDPFMAHVLPPKSLKLHAFPLLLIHAAYNAIWNPEEGSVTTFLQCKGCLSQSPVLSLIAAEIKYPGDMAQDQVNFMNVNKCENVYSIYTSCIGRRVAKTDWITCVNPLTCKHMLNPCHCVRLKLLRKYCWCCLCFGIVSRHVQKKTWPIRQETQVLKNVLV